MNQWFKVLTITLLASACAPDSDKASDNLEDTAQQLAEELLIIDTHIDVPYRLNKGWENVTEATEGGDFDYPRAMAGGLNAPFMSIYTPAEKGHGEDAFTHANAMIDLVEKLAHQSGGKFKIAHSVEEVTELHKMQQIALPLGMENGSPIGLDLSRLDHFHGRGIRYITLAHSKANQIADSSYDEERPNEGLSDFGHAVIRRMNQLGIMVDISHVSDKAFYDVLTVTEVPVIASHSSARHFTPGFERNMDDQMIRALAKNGGVIMINYGSAFLTAEANAYGPVRDAAYKAHLKNNGLTEADLSEDDFETLYRANHAYPYASLNDVLNHIDHVISLVGIAHVGIGSDYDGVGDSLPTGLKDVSSYPNLIKGLLERGYREDEIEAILSGNILRVWRHVEHYAARN